MRTLQSARVSLLALMLFALMWMVGAGRSNASDIPANVSKVESYTVWMAPQEAREPNSPPPTTPPQPPRLQLTVTLDGGGSAEYITTNPEDMRGLMQLLTLAAQSQAQLFVQHSGPKVLAFHLKPHAPTK